MLRHSQDGGGNETAVHDEARFDAGGEYVSPDEKLKFYATCKDGDWTLGFAGFYWHTHGDILGGMSGQDEISAVERFVSDLTHNVSVIAMTRIAGKLADIRVTYDPAEDFSDYKKCGAPDETIEFRLWDGAAVAV